jgi:chaperonin GroES
MSLDKLRRYMESANLAVDMDDEELTRIGGECIREYKIDDESRSDWVEDAEKSMDLAKMVHEKKSWPFEGAANIKYPLITTAAMQFAARAYPAVVDGSKVVKAQIVGDDPTGEKQSKGDRVAEHMSWQLLNEIEEWEEDTDTLLHQIPIVGAGFKKVYYSKAQDRRCIEFVPAIDLVVHNYNTRSLLTCPRITHRFERHPYEIAENQRSKLWLNVDLGIPQEGGNDSQAPHEFIEQHRYMDLDEDEIDEPYIVIVHVKSERVMRIVANYTADDVKLTGAGKVKRVARQNYFVRYQFMPAADGGFYGTGFGSLLRSINETVNSTLNQMLDAGTLQNAGGGFIGNGLSLRQGIIRQKVGEYQQINASGDDIRKSIVHHEHPGPSDSLFKLLGLMIEAAKEVASVKDILTGEAPKNTPATTTLALIEQGLMVFTSIYKRIHRSLKQELKLLFDLNARTLPPKFYFTVLDDQKAVAQEDYDTGSFDVIPVSDPKFASDTQKITRAQLMLEISSHPHINAKEAMKRFLIDTRTDRPEELLADPAPDVAGQMKAAKDFGVIAKMEAEATRILTEAIKNLATAEAAEMGPQLEQYKAQLQALVQQMGAQSNGSGDQSGGLGPVEGQPGDASLPTGPVDLPADPGGRVLGEAVEPGDGGPESTRPYSRADVVSERAY